MMQNKLSRLLVCLLFAGSLLYSIVSAGVGIKWDRESMLVNEGEKSCMTYFVYNPWPDATYATIELSDELKTIMLNPEAETKLIPENTASTDAIPIKFCFKIPTVYTKDCLLAGQLCEQTCSEKQKVYTGEVIIKATNPPTSTGGSGGSATAMSVSAPLTLRIACKGHSREMLPLYILVALAALIVIFLLVAKHNQKPGVVRDKERLEKLKAKIAKEEKKQKK